MNVCGHIDIMSKKDNSLMELMLLIYIYIRDQICIDTSLLFQCDFHWDPNYRLEFQLDKTGNQHIAAVLTTLEYKIQNEGHN